MRLSKWINAGISWQNQPLTSPQVEALPPPTAAPTTQLDRDWLYLRNAEEFSALTELEMSHMRTDFKKKYSKPALEKLLQELEKQTRVATKDDAVRDIEYACQSVSRIFPVNWKLNGDQALEYDGSTRFGLVGHDVWLNSNGAYCIVDKRSWERIFEKPAADGSRFVEPYGFGSQHT